MKPPTIALLLKAPNAGKVKTRLAATLGSVRAAAVYRQLVEHQIQALPRGWPASVHHAPAREGALMRRWLRPLHPELDFTAQRRGDLGARLAAACAREFARGAPSVLAIGGDCPGLDAAILRKAARALERTDVVLGPARDGGYYLIGLNQPQAELFDRIAWSTPAVLAQTRMRIHAAGLTFTELPQLEDVDDAASWRRALVARAFAGQPAIPGRAALH